MTDVLSQFAEACLHGAPDPENLAMHVDTLMTRLDFKAFMFSYHNDGARSCVNGRFDNDFLDEITNDPAYMTDPVTKGARESWTPIFWEAEDYRRCGKPFAHLFERAIEAGYRRGAATHVAGPFGQHCTFVAIYGGGRERMERDRATLSNAMTIAAPYAARAYRGANRPAGGYRTIGDLTQREIECLEWCARERPRGRPPASSRVPNGRSTSTSRMRCGSWTCAPSSRQ